MTDDVAMSTAAKELGLTPVAMELAAQLGEVRTAGGARGREPAVGASHGTGPGLPGPRAVRGGRRVPRSELARLRAAEDFPAGLRARLRVVDGRGGSQLLGITTSRFSRLARAGCFSPVRVYVNRYRTVVWLYLAAELLAFAEHRPELLHGRLSRGLRLVLSEGADLRARHWRGRRVGQLRRQAGDPWEAAAARVAVLDGRTLAEAVPDAGERARLSALRPELMPLDGRPAAVREVAKELCTASEEDEVFWQRLMLAADLEHARASERALESAAVAAREAPLDGRTAASPVGAGVRQRRSPAPRPPGRAGRGAPYAGVGGPSAGRCRVRSEPARGAAAPPSLTQGPRSAGRGPARQPADASPVPRPGPAHGHRGAFIPEAF